VILLLSFDEDQGCQVLFFCGSYQELLVNLEVKPYLEMITFLVDSVAHLSLTYIPTGTQLSDSKLLVSVVKGEGFKTLMFKKTLVKYKERNMEAIFLFVSEAGTNLLG
jgi:hypothetical protein